MENLNGKSEGTKTALNEPPEVVRAVRPRKLKETPVSPTYF